MSNLSRLPGPSADVWDWQRQVVPRSGQRPVLPPRRRARSVAPAPGDRRQGGVPQLPGAGGVRCARPGGPRTVRRVGQFHRGRAMRLLAIGSERLCDPTRGRVDVTRPRRSSGPWSPSACPHRSAAHPWASDLGRFLSPPSRRWRASRWPHRGPAERSRWSAPRRWRRLPVPQGCSPAVAGQVHDQSRHVSIDAVSASVASCHCSPSTAPRPARSPGAGPGHARDHDVAGRHGGPGPGPVDAGLGLDRAAAPTAGDPVRVEVGEAGELQLRQPLGGGDVAVQARHHHPDENGCTGSGSPSRRPAARRGRPAAPRSACLP